MQGWINSVRDIVDRVQALSPSTFTSACGGNIHDANGKGDGSNERVFALHPLSDAEPEAVRHTQRGVRLLHEGRIDDSLQELHDAKQQAPRSHEACSNLGCAYHMSGDDNAALYWYRQAQTFAPKDETAVLALALLEQRRGQMMESQKLLVKFLSEVEPSHISALKQLGRLHQQQGHWSQAGGCFHRLITIEPTNNEWPAQLQMCLDQVPLMDDKGQTVQANSHGNFARAFSFSEPILRQAVPTDSSRHCSNLGGYGTSMPSDAYPSSRQAAMQQLQESERTTQSPRSQRSLTNTHGSNRASARSSFSPIREESRSHCSQNREGSLPRNSEEPFWAVAQCFRMGAEGEEDRFRGQAKLLDKSSVSSANVAVTQLNRGIIQCPEGFVIVFSSSSQAYFLLYRNDTKDAAYAKFKRIMEQAPPGAAVQLQEAQRLRGSGRSDAALSVYRNVLRSDSRNAEGLLGVMDCLSDLGDLDAALEAGRQLIGLMPDEAEANLRMAELLLSANGSPEAVEPYIRRAAANSNSSKPALQHRLLCVIAETALAQDDLGKALSNAAEAVRIDSTARPLALLGAARLRIAEYPASLRALTAALDACKDSPSLEARRLCSTAHMLSAQAHERQRQYPQALAQAQAALELRPSFGDARAVKALALQQSGRGAEAEKELKQVLREEPHNALARLQLGYMKLSDGDLQAAIASLEVVVTSSAGVSRSMLGAAKVYLALALAGAQQQQAEKFLKEALALHRNLQHVWSEIENSLANQPTAAVQRLRGICDLDLSSQQARQVLGMLAQVHKRSDICNSFPSIATPASQQSARAPSVPPSRWAPTVEAAAQPDSQNRMRSVSPTSWGAIGGAGATSNMQRAGSMQVRGGRSVSPGAAGVYYAGGTGPARQRTGSADSQEGSPGRGRSLPMVHGQLVEKPASTCITLGWDEVIRPEQISYGQSLGSGGSASVFRGSWNGQDVAVKKISGLNHLEEMKKEINALRQLRHPRLVRFIGACIQPPQLLVVTEFMGGGSLHDRLFGKRQDPPLTSQQRWQVCLHTAEGLAFLHSNRVVHRDMKSMNILLDAVQNAKICDFGLTQQMEATHLARKSDGEGGSPRYMAPECYEASYGKLTEKVDIWAMGCIFIELFGNQLPYADCQSMAQLSARILVQRKPPDLPATVPAPLREVAKRCLMFDERMRINAGDLHAELGKVRRQLKMG